ncbi:unnamed protein product [Phytomonas sp. EM1]|nr:unnamed protein product [Phytomonas sp. EM1]|eukprot:CCW65642.1 unnamed protein product [Phytomonas sp. isolate EM1]
MRPLEVKHNGIPQQYYDVHERIVQYLEHPESFPAMGHVVSNYPSRSLPTEPSQKARDLVMRISTPRPIHRQNDSSTRQFANPSHSLAQTAGKECASSFDLEEAYNAMLLRVKERLERETNRTDAQDDEKSCV